VVGVRMKASISVASASVTRSLRMPVLMVPTTRPHSLQRRIVWPRGELAPSANVAAALNTAARALMGKSGETV
jgi:hypothetical protein